MSTVDPSGAIHGSDGKFTGHVAAEPDDSVSLSGGGPGPMNPLDDNATLEAVEQRNLAMAQSLNAIEDQINKADADLAAKDFAAQLARAERDAPSIRDAQVATVFVDRSDVDGRIVLTLCPDDDDMHPIYRTMRDGSTVAFKERFGMPGREDDLVDLTRLRAEGMKPAATGLWQVKDAAERAVTREAHAELRDSVREVVPSGRYVAYYDGTSDENPSPEGVYDADGNQVYGDAANPSWTTDFTVRDDTFEMDLSESLDELGRHAEHYWPDTHAEWVPSGCNVIDLDADPEYLR